MKITVPPDIERSLTARAEQLGTTPELLALDSLRERKANRTYAEWSQPNAKATA